MSIELPEAQILAKQMNEKLRGKQIQNSQLQDYQRLQRIGFINKDLSDFFQLNGGKVESVISRGNVIRVKLDYGMNLILAPEYGGKILYHTNDNDAPAKVHLNLHFTDNTMLTVALTGMGVIKAVKDAELEDSYVYKRDFSAKASPTNEAEFTFERFSKELSDKNVNLKAAIVGKDAIIVGLSNCAFQDIIYCAGIHPKRKASDLTDSEKQSLYGAIKHVVQERIRLGGKTQFVDLYGKQGNYTPAMGPNMKGQPCLACGGELEKLSLGGGQVYCCPICQK